MKSKIEITSVSELRPGDLVHLNETCATPITQDMITHPERRLQWDDFVWPLPAQSLKEWLRQGLMSRPIQVPLTLAKENSSAALHEQVESSSNQRTELPAFPIEKLKAFIAELQATNEHELAESKKIGNDEAEWFITEEIEMVQSIQAKIADLEAEVKEGK